MITRIDLEKKEKRKKKGCFPREATAKRLRDLSVLCALLLRLNCLRNFIPDRPKLVLLSYRPQNPASAYLVSAHVVAPPETVPSFP